MRQVTFEPTSVTALDVHEYGDGQGPQVLITAGVHGDEQTGIHAARLLLKVLENQPVHGRVKLIPVCNPAAFRNRTRRSPYDQVDLNRVFPGSLVGSPTLQLAHRLWIEAQGMDYLVDLHCAGVGSTPYALGVYEEFPAVRAVADALGVPVAVQSGGTRGQFFVEACHAGTKAVIIELPGGQPGGSVDLQAAELARDAVLNLLRRAGVVDGEPASRPVAFVGSIQEIPVPAPGFFSPTASVGDRVAEGDVLGEFDGRLVVAPCAGVIISLGLPRYCFAGERLAGVAPLA